MLILLVLVPLTAPLIWFMVQVVGVALLINPLICDYVKSESRGTANTLYRYGFLLSQLLMIAIFERTRNLTMTQKFWVPSVLLAPFVFALHFIVREPSISEKRLELVEHNNSNSTSLTSNFVQRF